MPEYLITTDGEVILLSCGQCGNVDYFVPPTELFEIMQRLDDHLVERHGEQCQN